MTIIFFTRRFYPSIGGVEKHILEISKILIKEKFEIRIVTENINNKLKTYEEFEGIKIYRMPFFKENKLKKIKIWFWFFKNVHLIKNANILHVHDVFYWYLPFRFLFLRKKVFITFHGYETIFPPRKGAILIRRISKFLSNGSINIGSYIDKWYKTPANFTFYGGVNKDDLKDLYSRFRGNDMGSGNDNNWNKKVWNIVFVGRIEKDNGIKIYADILKELKSKKVKFNFTAVGDGILSNDFKKYGKVVGFQKNINIFLKNADLVFSSSYLSMLEAFSFKKNVISVWENDLKKDYLYLTPFKDFIISGDEGKEIVNKLVSLSDKERENMINGAFDFAKKNTWEDVVKIYKKLWNL